jgi:DNA-directed RNA polymerase specialized sigma24 family protein
MSENPQWSADKRLSRDIYLWCSMNDVGHRVAEYRRQLIEFVRRRLPRSDREAGSDFVQDALPEAQERVELLRALTPKQTLAWLVTVLKYKMTNASRARQRQTRLQAGQHEPQAGFSAG